MSSAEPFKVELRHLMKDIGDLYTFEIWKIPIVENVDNFIDGKYHSIDFVVKEGRLEILMKGSGIRPDDFQKLPVIAFTTKASEETYLGRFGWGLKATLLAAERIEIETKHESFRGRQEWFWVDETPHHMSVDPKLNLSEDSTLVAYTLKKEYAKQINEDTITRTLQEFYPTLLAGAPALGVKREFQVNGKKVPPPEWLNEKNYRITEPITKLKVSGESLGGKIFISTRDLPEEQRGISIIVCGRRLVDERFDPFPDIKKYTGYVHADIFAKTLNGDKTAIKKANNRVWLEFKSMLSIQLEKALRNAGLLRDPTEEERETIRKISKLIAEILSEAPELQDLGIMGQQFGRRRVLQKGGDIPTTIEQAPSAKTDTPNKGEGGVDQAGLGPESLAVERDKEGKERSEETEKRVRGYPQIVITELENEQTIGHYLPGKILINNKHPLYREVRNNQRLRNYYVAREALQVPLRAFLKEGTIDTNKYLELEGKLLYMLGQHGL